MSTLNKFILVLSLSIFFLACNTDNDEVELKYLSDHIVFGHFYGLCKGETCIETFKINHFALFEDTLDNYQIFDNFSFVSLPVQKYLLVRDKFRKIPDLLWKEPDKKIFGCPDCYDQGGLFVQQSKSDTIRSWILDNNPHDVPEYLHDFMQNIKDAIILINK